MKIVAWLMAMVISSVAFAQNKTGKDFTITGELKNLRRPVAGVFLKSMDDDTTDYKVSVKNGRYRFKGIINGPTYINIVPIAPPGKRSDLNANPVFFYLEPGNTVIQHQGTFEKMLITGSATQREFEKLTAMAEAKKKKGGQPAEINDLYADYVEQHPGSPFAVHALQTYTQTYNVEEVRDFDINELPLAIVGMYLDRAMAGKMNLARVIPLFQSIPVENRESPAGQNMRRQIELGKVGELQNPFFFRLDSLAKLYVHSVKSGDGAEANRLAAKMENIRLEVNEIVYATYIRNNPQSPIALELISWYSGDNFDDPAKTAELYNVLSDGIKMSKGGLEYNRRLSMALKTAIGQVAPDFTQPDTAGVAVSLKSFSGKYLLLDFWASWCGPCRKENPEIISVFNQYKAKGFTVLSVSLDTDKKKWLEAIRKDGLAWTHVSDLKENNEVVKLYDILGIPANLLIGPDGKIIAKNLTGLMLKEKMAEIMP